MRDTREAAPGAGRRGPRLIGRDPEVRALVERIDAASAPAGGALLLRGPAGIGKSSLLEACRAHAAAKRFQVLTTTGVQSESTRGVRPIRFGAP